jgi:hypothetical protein
VTPYATSLYPTSFRVPISAEQEASYFYKLRQSQRHAKDPVVSLDVAEIATVDNLVAVFEKMKRENGTAPGPDRIRFGHIGRSELYGVMKTAREAVLAGRYRPGPAREVKIPKAGKPEYRTLTIRNLIDRVIAKAVHEALEPFWEGIFLGGSHGFRPERSNWTLLVELGQCMAEQDRWVLVSDDVKNAFPSVQIDRVLADHRYYNNLSNRLLTLLETILRGGDPQRAEGLDQGSPYMPVALNVHLHHAFDLEAHTLGGDPEHPTPWYRYADNLVVPCRSVHEGRLVLGNMAARLRDVGLTLKGENDGLPVNLRRGQSVQLLGFTLFKQGDQLGIKLGQGAWKSLERNLLQAHESNEPTVAAEAAISGWIDSYGPAFRNRRQDRTIANLRRLAAKYGFTELPGTAYYQTRFRGAYQRWVQLRCDRTRAAQKSTTTLSHLLPVPTPTTRPAALDTRTNQQSEFAPDLKTYEPNAPREEQKQTNPDTKPTRAIKQPADPEGNHPYGPGLQNTHDPGDKPNANQTAMAQLSNTDLGHGTAQEDNPSVPNADDHRTQTWPHARHTKDTNLRCHDASKPNRDQGLTATPENALSHPWQPTTKRTPPSHDGAPDATVPSTPRASTSSPTGNNTENTARCARQQPHDDAIVRGQTAKESSKATPAICLCQRNPSLRKRFHDQWNDRWGNKPIPPPGPTPSRRISVLPARLGELRGRAPPTLLAGRQRTCGGPTGSYRRPKEDVEDHLRSGLGHFPRHRDPVSGAFPRRPAGARGGIVRGKRHGHVAGDGQTHK